MKKKVCAWCLANLGSVESDKSGGDITHGICSLCALKLTRFEARTAEQILNFLREPVIMIDHEGMIKAANKSAKQILGKESEQIEEQLGGDVFECSYANLEGGCGRTEHCKTCAIRNIIMDTLSTGQGYSSVHTETRIFVRDQGMRKKLPQAYMRYSEDNFLSITQRPGKNTVSGRALF